MAVLHLGAVKPWVKSAAEEFSSQFGISNIGGWRAHGSVPNSDHPKGLALDLMTGGNKTLGDRTASYAQRNAGRLGVTYVIWYRRIWYAGTPADAWKAYTGPVPHTDHVHVSFRPTAPKGGDATVNAVNAGVTAIGSGAKSLSASVSDLSTYAAQAIVKLDSVANLAEQATKLFLPSNLVRLASGILGIAFLFTGIILIGKQIKNG